MQLESREEIQGFQEEVLVLFHCIAIEYRKMPIQVTNLYFEVALIFGCGALMFQECAFDVDILD